MSFHYEEKNVNKIKTNTTHCFLHLFISLLSHVTAFSSGVTPVLKTSVSFFFFLIQCPCPFLFYLFYFFIILYIYLAALGLCFCARDFSSCGEQGLLFVVVCGLLITVASLVAEHGL